MAKCESPACLSVDEANWLWIVHFEANLGHCSKATLGCCENCRAQRQAHQGHPAEGLYEFIQQGIVWEAQTRQGTAALPFQNQTVVSWAWSPALGDQPTGQNQCNPQPKDIQRISKSSGPQARGAGTIPPPAMLVDHPRDRPGGPTCRTFERFWEKDQVGYARASKQALSALWDSTHNSERCSHHSVVIFATWFHLNGSGRSRGTMAKGESLGHCSQATLGCCENCRAQR